MGTTHLSITEPSIVVSPDPEAPEARKKKKPAFYITYAMCPKTATQWKTRKKVRRKRRKKKKKRPQEQEENKKKKEEKKKSPSPSPVN